MTPATPFAAEHRRADIGAAVALIACVAVYLALLPLNLSVPDEGHALTAAKRILGGEAMYRDIFDLSTPGWPYLMAGLFSLFGTTLAVARVTAAIIHAAIAGGIFIACRHFAVRRSVAWAAGIVYVVACQPLFPVASYHWLSTLLCVALLLLCLRVTTSVAREAAIGIVTGLLIAVHQQRGVVMGVGVAALFVLEALLQRRYGMQPPAALWRRLTALAAGALLIVVPTLAALVARGGWAPVWDALIVFPLVSYRTAHQATPWAFEYGASPRGVSPWGVFFRYLPWVIPIAAARLLWLVARGRDYRHARALLVLVVLGAFSIASITYYPDIIHIAFIAPVLLILAAAGIERGLRGLPTAVGVPLGAVVASILIVACAGWMYRHAAELHELYRVRYASAFGPIDLSHQRQARIFDQLRRVLDATPGRTLFVFPMSYYMYLVVDGRNPTRHAFVVPGTPYTPLEYLQEIVAILDRDRVPYVTIDHGASPGEDPVSRFIRQNYEPLPKPQPLASVLWRRKAAANSSDGRAAEGSR
jgi:hypothetical protein